MQCNGECIYYYPVQVPSGENSTCHVSAHFKMRVINLINQLLIPKQKKKKKLRRTTLCYFLDMHMLIFQLQLVHDV